MPSEDEVPRELPLWMFHFVRDVRGPLPLLRVYQFAVPQKKTRDGAGQENVGSFALKHIITQNIKLRPVVDVM